MDDELFDALYHTTALLWPRREKRVQFSGRLLVLMFLWAVIRRKPRYWPCDGRHLPPALQNQPLPSVSQFRRRIKEPRFQELLDHLWTPLQGEPSGSLLGCWLLDAKAFLVSPYSKDHDARWGWACDRLGRGYKLFALGDLDHRIAAWDVQPMNQAEPTVARHLLQHTDRPGYVLGDSIYDSGPLHELAAARDLQLVAPRKEPGGPIAVRAQQPSRRHAIDLLETCHNTFGPALYALRTTIERVFARLACSHVGLDHLPPFVRTLPRVRLWVQAKLILYATLNLHDLPP